jgi:hypothetical protein
VRRRRGLAARPRDTDAVRPLLREDEAVEARGDVGARVARSVDLVEELRGDGAVETRPPVSGCFVITNEPSAWTSAIGKPRRSKLGTSSKNA